MFHSLRHVTHKSNTGADIILKYTSGRIYNQASITSGQLLCQPASTTSWKKLLLPFPGHAITWSLAGLVRRSCLGFSFVLSRWDGERATWCFEQVEMKPIVLCLPWASPPEVRTAMERPTPIFVGSEWMLVDMFAEEPGRGATWWGAEERKRRGNSVPWGGVRSEAAGFIDPHTPTHQQPPPLTQLD